MCLKKLTGKGQGFLGFLVFKTIPTELKKGSGSILGVLEDEYLNGVLRLGLWGFEVGGKRCGKGIGKGFLSC